MARVIRKLGQGGGLFNILDANTRWPVPSVGDAATVVFYTDRHAGTVIEVIRKGITPPVVKVWQDKATRTDSNGMSESQSYSYEENPKGAVWIFKRTKAGLWHEVYLNEETGRYKQTNGGTGVRFGSRDEYHDFSF